MKDNGMQMSPAERAAASILIVETDAGDRSNLRTALKNLAFATLADAPNHLAALEKFDDRKFTHLIFDAKKTNYPIKEWLQKIMEMSPGIVAIATSSNPSIDDVFDLLVVGAKGYLVKPFTFDSVDQAVLSATKGEPFSDAVLNAKDRNEALVAIMMSSLDKFATIYRQSQQFETAKRELPRAMGALKRSSDLAQTFAKGGVEGLIEALERFCIERSKGPASKLGRLRKRLNNTRGAESATAD